MPEAGREVDAVAGATQWTSSSTSENSGTRAPPRTHGSLHTAAGHAASSTHAIRRRTTPGSPPPRATRPGVLPASVKTVTRFRPARTPNTSSTQSPRHYADEPATREPAEELDGHDLGRQRSCRVSRYSENELIAAGRSGRGGLVVQGEPAEAVEPSMSRRRLPRTPGRSPPSSVVHRAP
jgi:hypothetical protein